MSDVPSKRCVDLIKIPMAHPPTLTVSNIDKFQIPKEKITGLSRLSLKVTKVSTLLRAGEEPSFDLDHSDYFN